MAATTFHSVIIVFWKEAAFPRWRAMDRRWKRNSVSLVSSVTTVMRLPISCVSNNNNKHFCSLQRCCQNWLNIHPSYGVVAADTLRPLTFWTWTVVIRGGSRDQSPNQLIKTLIHIDKPQRDGHFYHVRDPCVLGKFPHIFEITDLDLSVYFGTFMILRSR